MKNDIIKHNQYGHGLKQELLEDWCKMLAEVISQILKKEWHHKKWQIKNDNTWSNTQELLKECCQML